MTLRDGRKIDSSRLKNHIDAMAKQVVDVEPDASSRHLHNGRDTPLPPADLHGTYVNHKAEMGSCHYPCGGCLRRSVFLTQCRFIGGAAAVVFGVAGEALSMPE